MKEKITENCNFNHCKDKLQQLQNLLKSNIEGDYKVMIMGDVMDELTNKKKPKEALALAAQAKSEYPKSLFMSIFPKIILSNNPDFNLTAFEINFLIKDFLIKDK